MPLRKLEPLLRNSILDRETKLQIIDLIVHTKDETSLKALMEHLSAWKQADDETVKQLVDQITALRDSYAQQEEQTEQHKRRKTLELADEVAREEKMQLIRNRILNLL